MRGRNFFVKSRTNWTTITRPSIGKAGDMQRRIQELLAVFMTMLLVTSGCSESTSPEAVSKNRSPELLQETPVYKRWYSQEQLATGNLLFQEHCAVCHKVDASGTPNWKETDAAGHLPPPPLNGTAHTWHHSLSVLRRVVALGGARLGGTMPAFGEKLNSEQIDAVLAWVQSHWTDNVYTIWQERNRG